MLELQCTPDEIGGRTEEEESGSTSKNEENMVPHGSLNWGWVV